MIVVGKRRVLEMKFLALVDELRDALSVMCGAAAGAATRS